MPGTGFHADVTGRASGLSPRREARKEKQYLAEPAESAEKARPECRSDSRRSGQSRISPGSDVPAGSGKDRCSLRSRFDARGYATRNARSRAGSHPVGAGSCPRTGNRRGRAGSVRCREAASTATWTGIGHVPPMPAFAVASAGLHSISLSWRSPRLCKMFFFFAGFAPSREARRTEFPTTQRISGSSSSKMRSRTSSTSPPPST